MCPHLSLSRDMTFSAPRFFRLYTYIVAKTENTREEQRTKKVQVLFAGFIILIGIISRAGYFSFGLCVCYNITFPHALARVPTAAAAESVILEHTITRGQRVDHKVVGFFSFYERRRAQIFLKCFR